jgi:hypothetical protein
LTQLGAGSWKLKTKVLGLTGPTEAHHDSSYGPKHFSILRELLMAVGTGGNLTSDAHLAALAIEHGAELCSSDYDFGRFPRLKWSNPLGGNTLKL